jgi:hypothetical protein
MSRGIEVIERALKDIKLETLVDAAEQYSLNKWRMQDEDAKYDGTYEKTDWIRGFLYINLIDGLKERVSNRMLMDYDHTYRYLVNERLYDMMVEYYKLRKLFAFSEDPTAHLIKVSKRQVDNLLKK